MNLKRRGLLASLLPLAACAGVSDGGVPNPLLEADHGGVFLFPGLTLPGESVVRSGTYAMTQAVRAQGVFAEINTPGDWDHTARQLMARPDAASLPVAVMGYSFGANAAISFARVLTQQAIPVQTLFLVEAYAPIAIPWNVRRAVHVYTSDAAFTMATQIRPDQGFAGSLENIRAATLRGGEGSTHWSLAFLEELRRFALAEMLDGDRVRRREPDGRSLPYAA